MCLVLNGTNITLQQINSMEQPIINEATATTIVEHHFRKRPVRITRIGNGLANYVYEAEIEDGTLYIIRISDLFTKLSVFLKEQWAVGQAHERGVPVPEILEVGNEAVPHPYMVVKKVIGVQATIHPERIKIIQQMGKYSAVINTIPTTSFGHVFDWSNNTLSKHPTWKEFLDKEFNVPERIQIFERNEILSDKNLQKLKQQISEIEQWDKSPTLNHSDMRLKNVLVDETGKIAAILDWENAISNIAPYWEIAIALHDLTIDEKQAFLEGYGIREKDFHAMAPGIKALNILHYATFVNAMIERKDSRGVERYKLRLNGNLDLYSL